MRYIKDKERAEINKHVRLYEKYLTVQKLFPEHNRDASKLYHACWRAIKMAYRLGQRRAAQEITEESIGGIKKEIISLLTGKKTK